jgi:hypothetical protein
MRLIQINAHIVTQSEVTVVKCILKKCCKSCWCTYCRYCTSICFAGLIFSSSCQYAWWIYTVNTRKNIECLNTGLLKHGFRVMSSWWLKKMFKMTTLNFHVGIAGHRLLVPYFLPPRLTGAVYCVIPLSVLPELLQGVDLQTEIELMVHTWWRCTKFFSCASGSFAKRVSGTLDRTKWTKSMACSFP